MIKIVVDAMGLDKGEIVVINAVKKFLGTYQDAEVILVGPKEKILLFDPRLQIEDAREVLPMDAHAMEAMRNRETSLYKAVDYHLTHETDALVSGGSTGGYLSLASMKLKNISGIKRAALVTPFPTYQQGKFIIMLDIGATSEVNAEQLCDFAFLGKVYYESLFATKNPSIKILSNGVEAEKGTPVTREASSLLKAKPALNFQGYIEARDVFLGETDVIVTDGYTGNVFLKTSEGIIKMIMSFLKDSFKKNLFTKIGYLFSKKGLQDMKARFDYNRVGGAVLLGLNKLVIKAHGSSNEEAFYSSMELAYRLAKAKMIETIKAGIIDGD
ncbi:MAG: phosphate acyltransferase PlsX [Erysipelotrichaceae bacterium]|jgi:glycerol-3-phosphate acyltransferase PlsX|nr:phosphate acyltransferase PlsX [Erysipelotrichaceae bacterium]